MYHIDEWANDTRASRLLWAYVAEHGLLPHFVEWVQEDDDLTLSRYELESISFGRFDPNRLRPHTNLSEYLHEEKRRSYEVKAETVYSMSPLDSFSPREKAEVLERIGYGYMRLQVASTTAFVSESPDVDPDAVEVDERVVFVFVTGADPEEGLVTVRTSQFEERTIHVGKIGVGLPRFGFENGLSGSSAYRHGGGS